MPGRLSKIAAKITTAERAHYREGELGPGVAERTTSSLPKIQAPQVWEFSAHPHLAEKAGPHIDIRLGNPATGIAHSFVLPKRTELPKPGESALVVPTYDHTIKYMDFTGRISTEYGKGKVVSGRRTQAEVHHADPDDKPGTKLRFNLYDERHPEEFSIRKDQSGKWFIHNKTLSRERRPDIPSGKPSYKEIDVEKVDTERTDQVMMPKLDGAHSLIDLQAGRSPRVFSYRVGKLSPTGLIEHTHKLTDLLKDTVPKELDNTLLRGETIALRKGKALPEETIGGLLNAKVWESRAKQEELGARLHAFPFDVVKYRGKSMEASPFSEKLKVLKEVEQKIGDLWLPDIATTPKAKSLLLKRIGEGKYPLTREGVVLVEPEVPGVPTKAKFAPDFDVFVRKVHPAVSGKTGKEHDRAGSISYSWTEDGPIVGQVGGFSHDLGRDMIANPDRYVGRVAKVKATKVFVDEQGGPGALFQPRFKGWHLEKGNIEKAAFLDELQKIASKQKVAIDPLTIAGATAGGKILLSNFLSRHGLKIPGVRHLVGEVMGVGYRTAKQGKPMLSKPFREALALGTDSNLVNAYEMAHGAGRASKALGGGVLGDVLRQAPTLAAQSGMLPKPYVKLLSNIPTESKGLRKMVDYGFTPVGQVGSDIAQAGKGLMQKLRGPK